jgi:putative DNA methylase
MHKKKLIEVAIPLDAINKEAAREKSIRHGHPSTLHLWWARRPLATCRAVLFASLVDDPSAHTETFPTEEEQALERDRLFRIMEDLVRWENSSDPLVLERARNEILASCDGDVPRVLDPFAGGGSIPLEAQRLGLVAEASDLNPVPVLINKALIEVPPLFAGRAPVNPGGVSARELQSWSGAQGLADDIRYYGLVMQANAARAVGHLFPTARLPPEHGGSTATVIAWIWARTVRSPNPAWDGHVPLVRSFVLSTKKGRRAWIEPLVNHDDRTVSFEIRTGSGEPPPGTVERSGARCLATGSPIPFDYIRSEASAGRMGQQMMAIVAEGDRQRVYLQATPEHESVAESISDSEGPAGEVAGKAKVNIGLYGMREWQDLYTRRQKRVLAEMVGQVAAVREQIRDDAVRAGWPDDQVPLRLGGTGALAYAEAVSLYLGFVVSRASEYLSTAATWSSNAQNELVRGAFSRQALAMSWDFAEANPFAGSSGDFGAIADRIAKVIERLPPGPPGRVRQLDATTVDISSVLVSTDPPYYDNISYADLSDYFYVWLRQCVASVYPDECSTLLVPKAQELVATPFRFGGSRGEANRFFERGLGDAFKRMHAVQDDRFPLTVYYAFKQVEGSEDGTASTGWETMLEGLLDAGFTVDGTWPMRSERGGRMISVGANALATSIVLVCRQRPAGAVLATRKEFIARLKGELPSAVRALQHGSIAPVDMAQAAIGPGMAVFSSYSKVVEANGEGMTVRTALELINQVLDETIAGTDADFDGDTRWAVTWFEDCGMNEGDFGRAEQLSKSRNTSVPGLAEAGVIVQRPGKVRLTTREELPKAWDPRSDERLTVWEVTQHLIRRLEEDGEAAAASLLRQVGSDLGETAKELAYRLYLICERKGWAKEAISYNALVAAWPELTRLAASDQVENESEGQGQLL